MFLSPINQLSASLSLLFFALALQIEKKNLSPLLESTLIPAFFIFSLLSYEITAPLILTYYLVNSLRARKRGLIFEAACVFVIFVAWQKIVAPNLFLSDFSRIRAFNPGAGISLFFSTGVSFPLSLLTALFDPGKFLYILLFCGFLFLVSRKHSNVVTSRSNKSISLALFAGIASSSLLFFIAGAYSQINGYQNRGMSGTWVLISLLIATRYELSGKVGKILIILVVSTNFLVFSGKVFESIEASKAREKVVTQVSDYLTASGDTAPVVFLDMPCITPADEYKTEVFCTSWDALGALRARGISLSNVSPIGDPAFVGNWESSDIPDGSLNFKFDKEFILKDVSRAMPDDFDFRTGLFATSNRYLLEVENRKLSCKALARNIILANFQLDWAEVVRCASDPFT
jgi:hypothetical protein